MTKPLGPGWNPDAVAPPHGDVYDREDLNHIHWKDVVLPLIGLFAVLFAITVLSL